MAIRKQRFSFTLYREEVEALKILAERRNRSVSGVIGLLAAEELQRVQASKPKGKPTKQAA